MPIKQVMCCKCSNLVNKAQTYSIGKDQRACKTHEGVVEKKCELEVAKIQQRKVETHKHVLRDERKGNGGWAGDPMKPRCWVCMNEGLRQEEFFTRILIEREKAAQIYGPFSPFDPEHPGNKIKIGRCIFILMADKCTNAMKYVREDFAMLVQMGGGVIAICGQCCGTFKIDPLPKMDPKDLTKWMVIGELVKPVIQKMANAEMAKVN